MRDLYAKLLALPRIKQIQLGGALLLFVAGAIALAQWASAPDWAPLYQRLPEKESGAVVSALDQLAVAHKIADNGSILVERSAAHEARFRLAAMGLPKSSAGVELPEPPRMGASSAMEADWRQKALEAELSRSLMSIGQVQSARVHLAIPKPSVFSRESSKPSASVVLDLLPGATLSKPQVEGVERLVGMAVPELEGERVAIVDSKGALLNKKGPALDPASLNAEQRQMAVAMAAEAQAKVERLLEPIAGSGGARAEVSFDLDFSTNETISEQWRPNGSSEDGTPAAIRSQQSAEKADATKPGGVPGSATNAPPQALPPLPGAAPNAALTPQNGPAGKSSETRSSTVNYELDKTTRRQVAPSGQVRRVSASVALNVRKGPDGKPAPYTEAEIKSITGLVRDAIGYDEARKDSVQIVNMAFAEQAPAAAPTLLEQLSLHLPALLALAKPAGFVFGALLLWALFLRPVLRVVREALAPPPAEPVFAEGAFPDVGLPAAAVEKPEDPNKMTVDKAREMAKANPQVIASLIKDWIKDDQ